MKRVVIDSDIFIDHLRGLKNAKNFFRQLATGEFAAYFSALTEAELVSGQDCASKEKRKAVLDLLAHATKVPVNNAIAVKAGDLRRTHGLSISDALIAATASEMKAVLLTRNAADFARVKEAKIEKPY